MKRTSIPILKFSIAASLCIMLSGCASLGTNVKKAPCGPIAGMTDACGNRTPINNQKMVKINSSRGYAYLSLETV